jgi:hypothetical protein
MMPIVTEPDEMILYLYNQAADESSSVESWNRKSTDKLILVITFNYYSVKLNSNSCQNCSLDISTPLFKLNRQRIGKDFIRA